MAETINRGPTVSLGATEDARVEGFDGPSLEYQGVVTIDPRFAPVAKDGLAPGRIAAFYNSPTYIVTDAIGQATGSTIVAAAQAPSTTSGVALTIATAQALTAQGAGAYCPGVPILPVGTTTVVTVGAIDFGFTTGTTTASSSSVTVVDNSVFDLGQWLVIPGAGAQVTAQNQALICQVASVSSNTTILFISPVAQTGLSNIPIGQGNLYSQFLPPATQFGPSAASAVAAEPYRLAGLAKVFDPVQALTRNITVQAATATSGTGTFLVTGYDVYGNLMTELLTASGTTSVAGKKAFKYISSVTVKTAATTGTPANVTIGLGNEAGINLRSNKWEYLDIFFNGGFAINNTGWTAAFTGSPSTNTTGDVRGAVNCSTVIVGASSGTTAAGGGFNGTSRLTITQSIEQLSMIHATPLNSASLFGVAQSTT